MKRPLVYCTLCYIAGITLANLLMPFLFYIAIFLLISTCCFYFYRRTKAGLVFLLPFFFGLGILLFFHHLYPKDPWIDLLAEANAEIQLAGTVKEIKSYDNGVHQLGIKADCILWHNEIYPTKLSFWAKNIEANVSYGQNVLITGTISNFNFARNPYAFDEFIYRKSDNYEYQIRCDSILTGNVANGPVQWVRSLSGKLAGVYDKVLPPEEAGILKAMILGDKESLDDSIVNLYRDSGISHILVVSGLHVSVLSLFLFKGMSLFHISKRKASALTIGILVFYLFLIGFGSSALRAVFMAGFVLMGTILYRQPDIYTSIAGAALFMFLYQPLWLFRSGVQLSFVLVLALVMLVPAWNNFNIFTQKFRTVTGPPLVAFLASAPLCAYYFYSVSTASLLVNLLIVPFVAVIVCVGFITGLIGLVFMPCAQAISVVVFAILKAYKITCTFFTSIPFSVLYTGKPTLFFIFAWYSALLFIFAYSKLPGIYQKKCKFGAYACIMAICVNSLSHILLLNPFQITFLDVNQGDAMVIHTKNDHTFMMDTGGYPYWEGSNTGKSIVYPYLSAKGIRTVDGIFISHPDADHCLGLLELMELVQIRAIYIPDGIFIDNSVYNSLIEKANQYTIPIYRLKAGDVLSQDGVTFEFLYPPANRTYDADPNSSSLVCRLQYQNKLSILLTGDMEAADERLLLETGQDVSADILKVAHHGSKTSSTPEFVQAVSPMLGICGVGASNRYGHPAPQTLLTFEELHIPILDTAANGAIIFVETKSSIAVDTMKERSYHERIKK